MSKQTIKKYFLGENFNLVLLLAIFLLGVIPLIPLLSKIPNHPDEHQFYLNAFKIMGGQELHNYLHIALTEYALAAFFLIVNIVTTSGVNFPQGDPSLVTFYYGKVFGFVLYLLTFILGAIIVQRGEKKIKLRTVIFSILYFGSIGLVERFVRVNSDSMSIFVFLNFVIWSFWLHRQKASFFKFFLVDLVFVFLGSFTNLKSLYLMFPLVVLNTVVPLLRNENQDKPQLPGFYKLVLSSLGVAFGSVILWGICIPRPFNPKVFWYTIKKTIVHGTQFDFDYSSQAFNSWVVYLYDLVMEYLGLTVVFAIGILLLVAYSLFGKEFFRNLWLKVKNQAKIKLLKTGNIYAMTELVLLASFISYYLGVSSAVVHYSRWGAPLGLLAIMILSTVVEKILEPILALKKIKPQLLILLPSLFLLAWLLRVDLNFELAKTTFYSFPPFPGMTKDVDDFLEKENVKPEDFMRKAAWFTGRYTYNIGGFSLEDVTKPENSEIKYIFWPSWNIGLVYTNRNIDLSTHNQRAIIDKYAEKVYYRYPGLMAFYTHITKFFAWRFLGITWWPEIDNMIETHYAVVKLKKPVREITLAYEVPSRDMSQYYFPLSKIYNIANLPDGYLFPTCYAYAETKSVADGHKILPPPELGVGGQNAGLYCRSVRFRVFFKGIYQIKVEGLPEDLDKTQHVYSNMPFDWNPITKTMTLAMPTTFIPGEVGVATKERNPKNLRFLIFYSSQI